LDAALPEYSTEILDAPGINATKILNVLKHIFTEILNAPRINAIEILDAFRQNVIKILNARLRIIQAQINPVRSQILNAIN
jgi:hypothetical protein